MTKVMVTTSWDDGHRLDMRLARLLKKYQIKGTFYVCARNREFDREDLLSDEQVIELNKNFEIGAHTMTHPILYSDFKVKVERLFRWLLMRGKNSKFEPLLKISKQEAEKEIRESKRYLEELIGERVVSFCYPDGRYDDEIIKLVHDLEFKYARTVRRFEFKLNGNRYAAGTSLHAFNHGQDLLQIAKFCQWNPVEISKCLDWEDLGKKMFDYVLKYGGIYHLWGHSWEIEQNGDWEKLERVFSYIGGKSGVVYGENRKLVKYRSNE